MKKQTDTFLKLAKNANTFWDLGSHVGYYSILFNAVSPAGRIFAFEPVADTVNTYNKHMALNKISNYKIFTAAVSDKEGICFFKKTTNSVAGRLDDSGETEVPVLKLSGMVSAKTIDVPNIIKMDIEGAEVVVLKDLLPLLKEKMPILFVSTHGPEIHKNCVSMLKEIGYNLQPLDKDNIETSKEFVAMK